MIELEDDLALETPLGGGGGGGGDKAAIHGDLSPGDDANSRFQSIMDEVNNNVSLIGGGAAPPHTNPPLMINMQSIDSSTHNGDGGLNNKNHRKLIRI